MRVVTGGHALWMGGWTGQVHRHQDIIGRGGLERPPAVLARLMTVARTLEAGLAMLPPAYALADGLIFDDHRVMPPDEIDPEYLEADEMPALLAALEDLGCSPGRARELAAPYRSRLGGKPEASLLSPD